MTDEFQAQTERLSVYSLVYGIFLVIAFEEMVCVARHLTIVEVFSFLLFFYFVSASFLSLRNCAGQPLIFASTAQKKKHRNLLHCECGRGIIKLPIDLILIQRNLPTFVFAMDDTSKVQRTTSFSSQNKYAPS